jgi:hypothetical protein
MAEIKEFVINDRRKFTAEGDLRPDAPPSEPKVAAPLPVESEARLIPESEHRPDTSAASSGPHLVGGAEGMDADEVGAGDEAMPPPPTMEQIDQAKRAYDATIDRLDTAIRATNPGIDRMPPMSFDRVVQSIYMQALMQLGGAAAPGQQPQVDLLGARQTVDMLVVLEEKTRANLSEAENSLLQSALFELRLAFLEITQAIARQAAQRQPGAPGAGMSGAGMPPIPGGPSIVR